jgi:hypothetical protein
LIKNVVKKINDGNITINMNSINYIVSLKDTEDVEDIDFYAKNYEIKPCKKKNHMPKVDSPSFSPSSLLKNIQNENLSFVCKKELNIMLREKFETIEEGNVYYESDFEEEY